MVPGAKTGWGRGVTITGLPSVQYSINVQVVWTASGQHSSACWLGMAGSGTPSQRRRDCTWPPHRANYATKPTTQLKGYISE
jgi:hypothetical protein